MIEYYITNFMEETKMEVNLIAVKMMIMLMLGALVISLIYFGYLEIDSGIKRKSKRMIYDKIVKCLLIYCNLRGILVYIDNGAFKEDHAEASGYISFNCDKNTGIVYEATIYLRNDEDIYIDLVWSILAHEVGHYISQDVYNDDSEEGANMEAHKFIYDLFMSIPNIRSF